MSPIRLLLADDQPMLRTGFRTVLGAEPGLDVVGEAGDGVEAVELARRLLPDVVLMDIRLPRQDGLAATRAIAATGLPVRVLLLTSRSTAAGQAANDWTANDWTAGDLAETQSAVRAGAYGFLAKDLPPAQLVAAIRAIAAGQAVLPPRALRGLLDHDRGPAIVVAPASPSPLDGLTDREREVLGHLARGLSNGEVAQQLLVSETTVKTHVGNLLTKLGVRDRVQAVVLAYESGLIRPMS